MHSKPSRKPLKLRKSIWRNPRPGTPSSPSGPGIKHLVPRPLGGWTGECLLPRIADGNSLERHGPYSPSRELAKRS